MKNSFIKSLMCCTAFVMFLIGLSFNISAEFDEETDLQKIELGKKIFFDTNLSKPVGQSCASCHAP